MPKKLLIILFIACKFIIFLSGQNISNLGKYAVDKDNVCFQEKYSDTFGVKQNINILTIKYIVLSSVDNDAVFVEFINEKATSSKLISLRIGNSLWGCYLSQFRIKIIDKDTIYLEFNSDYNSFYYKL